ncbi:unnamed protein product [Pedinophyceae sp. YPF-701]|nr:unnamed protein product [Pedinophyceae sp. YPF-701]
MFAGIEYSIAPATRAAVHADVAPKKKDLSLANALGRDIIRLDRRELDQVPKELLSHSTLRTLSLARNNLSSVPDGIRGCSSLRRLNLAGNKLSSLPDALGDLKELQELRVEDNSLTSLPPALGKVATLTFISLNGNPLTGELKEAWYGPAPADGSAPPPVPTEKIAERTAAVLAVLRGQLSDADLAAVKEKEAADRRKAAAQALEGGICGGDAGALRAAIGEAEAAGVVMPKGVGMRAKECMVLFESMGSSKDDEEVLKEALTRWEAMAARGAEKMGPTVRAAMDAMRELKRERLERGFRQRAEASMTSLGGAQASAASVAAASRPLATAEASAASHAELGPGRSTVAVGLAQLTKNIGFDDWVKAKKQKEKEAEEALRRHLRTERSTSKAVSKQKRHEELDKSRRESGWPSQHVEERKHGSYTDVERLKAARKMRGNPQGMPPSSRTVAAGGEE